MKESETVIFELRNNEPDFALTKDEMIHVIYSSMVNSMFLEGDKVPFEGHDPVTTMNLFEDAYFHL